METLNYIANQEFGLDYDQLGENEKVWCQDELDNRIHKRHEEEEWEATRESKIIRFDIT